VDIQVHLHMGTRRRAPQLGEHLAGKVTEILGSDLTYGYVLRCCPIYLRCHGQRRLSQQSCREGAVEQCSADGSINLVANVAFGGPTWFATSE
jgi:hypothetical protein